jgi:hypothetical protein
MPWTEHSKFDEIYLDLCTLDDAHAIFNFQHFIFCLVGGAQDI